MDALRLNGNIAVFLFGGADGCVYERSAEADGP